MNIIITSTSFLGLTQQAFTTFLYFRFCQTNLLAKKWILSRMLFKNGRLKKKLSMLTYTRKVTETYAFYYCNYVQQTEMVGISYYLTPAELTQKMVFGWIPTQTEW